MSVKSATISSDLITPNKRCSLIQISVLASNILVTIQRNVKVKVSLVKALLSAVFLLPFFFLRITTCSLCFIIVLNLASVITVNVMIASNGIGLSHSPRNKVYSLIRSSKVQQPFVSAGLSDIFEILSPIATGSARAVGIEKQTKILNLAKKRGSISYKFRQLTKIPTWICFLLSHLRSE